jgi:hypothetical protein
MIRLDRGFDEAVTALGALNNYLNGSGMPDISPEAARVLGGLAEKLVGGVSLARESAAYLTAPIRAEEQRRYDE